MNNTHSCPEPGELAALIDGELKGEERLKILDHIDRCELCSELVGDAMHTLDALDQEPVPIKAEKESGEIVQFPIRAWMGGAVAVAALLLLTFNLDLFGPNNWEKADQEGQIHLSDAAGQLGQGTLLQYQLPVISNEALVANASNFRSGAADPMLEHPEFLKQIGLALKAFEQAQQSKPDYLPAMRHRLTTLVLAQKYTTAYAIYDPEIEDSSYQQLGAIAMFYADLKKEGIDLMDSLPWRTEKDKAYNLAMMLTEDGQRERALEVWRIFLELEPEGIYSKEARRLSGL